MPCAKQNHPHCDATDHIPDRLIGGLRSHEAPEFLTFDPSQRVPRPSTPNRYGKQ